MNTEIDLDWSKQMKKEETFGDKCNKAWKNINDDKERKRKALDVKKNG
jgi:hypothetical protein